MKKSLLMLAGVFAAVGLASGFSGGSSPSKDVAAATDVPEQHLYITGDGDFESGSWTPGVPGQFEYVDGQYVITVENLSAFKISTTFGDWDAFNEGALTCDYGDEPGVTVPLEPGDANITCPVRATWTITVAGDLSNITLTTDEPVVIVPIEKLPIYLRGDMNDWMVSDEWKLNLLGKDSDGTAVYAFTCGEETQIDADFSFKIAAEDWSKINIGSYDDMIEMDKVMIAVNGQNPYNFTTYEAISGVIYLRMNYATNEGAIYVSNDKETPCPFPYEGYVVPDPTPDPDPVAPGAPLYITGDGDFEGGQWNPGDPDQFEYVDGQYVITVENLSVFKISTTSGIGQPELEKWDAFIAGGLTCDYGDEPGVTVPLEPGNSNITCPVKATWTITVAGDLSNITLTTDEPVVIVPIEKLPIYLRGDMNDWMVSDEWKLNLLGKDSDGTAVYAFTCGDETQIDADFSFKIAAEDWSKINIGSYDDMIEMDKVMIAVNGQNPYNFTTYEAISGVIYLRMNYATNEGAIYVSNDKETPCPFPYEGYVVPDPTPDPDPVTPGAPLYIVGDGDFEGGQWNPEEPDQFEYVDGKYVITVENLSTFKISTTCVKEQSLDDPWSAFDMEALTCDYGEEPGVEALLYQGTSNIKCPAKATWTITVAGDLSTITLTTDNPIVIIPVDELPIYLRGDMNDFEVSEEWRMNLLGKDSDGALVYSYTFGEDAEIAAESEFKIGDEGWSKVNIGAMDANLYMDEEMYALNANDPHPFTTLEAISGVLYLRMNYDTNIGSIYVSNDKATPCPFPYEGYVVPTPEPEPVKVNVVVSDGTAFGYRVRLEEDTQLEVSLADEYWKVVSYTYNGDPVKFDEPVSSVVISFAAGEKNDFEILAEYCGTLEVMESSGVAELTNNVTITVNEDSVEISGLEAGTSVAVYTLGGQTIMSRVASEPVMTIRLDKGQTYIVRAGDAAVKVML